jgi:hypothetical protein
MISINLKVLSGGNVSYIFNSLGKYESGISYEDWTRFQIYYNDTTEFGGVGTSVGWDLQVRAITSGIVSDGGNPELDTETITIRPNISSCSGCVGSTNVSLTNVFQTIVIGDGNLSILEEVSISYDCGVDPAHKVLNKPPDYYNVDLEFRVFPRY